MVFENILTAEWLKVVLLLIVGVVLAIIAKFVINKLAKFALYPWVRKHSLRSYKKSILGVNLITIIIQWIIILLFVLQALSVLEIYLSEELLRISINYLPKIAIAFLVIVIGLILTELFSRKIRDSEFKGNQISAKIFEIIFITATVLSALEVLGVRLTAFLDLYRIALLGLALTVAIAIGIALGLALKPEFSNTIKNIKKKS